MLLFLLVQGKITDTVTSFLDNAVRMISLKLNCLFTKLILTLASVLLVYIRFFLECAACWIHSLLWLLYFAVSSWRLCCIVPHYRGSLIGISVPTCFTQYLWYHSGGPFGCSFDPFRRRNSLSDKSYSAQMHGRRECSFAKLLQSPQLWFDCSWWKCWHAKPE